MELRIKDVLENSGVKVSSLAESVGITRANMSNIVNGKSMPSIDTLEKIATALNVPMWQLFASPEEVQPKTGTASFSCPHCGKSINIKAE